MGTAPRRRIFLYTCISYVLLCLRSFAKDGGIGGQAPLEAMAKSSHSPIYGSQTGMRAWEEGSELG